MASMMPALLLLLACTDDTTSSRDSGIPHTTDTQTDSGTPTTDTDTGVPTDSVPDSGTGETGETGTTDTIETGDTDSGTTAETGDTGPSLSLLDYYTPAGDPFEIAEITSNLSGITWIPDTKTYLAVLDSNRRLFELAEDFTVLRELELEDVSHSDTEDIVYLGLHEGEPEIALVSETSVIVIGTVPADATSVDVSSWQELTFAPEPESRNAGGEGVAYDPVTETFWACSEKSPRIVWTFTRPARGSDLTYEDGSLVVNVAFDAEALLEDDAKDISSCMYDSRTGQLLILSHESGQVVDVGLDGTVYGTLPVELDLTSSDKAEALTMLESGDLVVGGEPNEMRVYSYTGP